MNKIMLVLSGFLCLSLLSACVAKKDFLKLQNQLAETEKELEVKEERMQEYASKLEAAKSRLAELDEAQRQMEESLRSEIEDKSIRLQKLNDRLTVTFVDKILFDSGSDSIKPKGKNALTKVAHSISQMENHLIHVEGHTDNQKIGPKTQKIFKSNWELSTARATSVVKFLQVEGQIDPARLFAVGGAFYHPVADNSTPEGRSQNRRVEIVLTPILKDIQKEITKEDVPEDNPSVPEEKEEEKKGQETVEEEQ